MSHLLDELLAQAANGSPLTAAFSSEDVAVLLFASEFLGVRENWLDRGVDPLDEVTDADWDEIEKLVGNVYEALMNPLIGLIFPVITSLPSNMLPCDGTTYLRTDYPALYAALNAAFIVDADHFKTPDLRGRTVIGAGTGTGLSARAVGAIGGTEAETLNASQNGVHTHLLTDPGHTHPQQIGAVNAFLGTGGTGRTAYGAVTTSSTTQVQTVQAGTGLTVQNSAGGSPHNNMQPFEALTYGVVAY